MNNKREKRLFVESELPLDTVLNPGMMILNERANLEDPEFTSMEGIKERPVDES